MDKPKTKVYIDGSNTFHAQKKLGWLIDWRKVKEMINKDHEDKEWRYYVGLKDGDMSMKSFLNYLEKVKIDVFSKSLKKIKIQVADIKSGIEEEKWIYKANFDVEITADILMGLENIDKVIIFSGDSDFNYLAKIVNAHNKKMDFFTSKKTVAWEIRKISGSRVQYFEDLKTFIEAK